MSSSTEFAPLRVGVPVDVGDERAAARAAGYAEGWAAGRREAQEAQAADDAHRAQAALQVATAQQDQVDRALAALAEATADLRSRSVQAISEITDLVLDSALTLTRSLLASELALADQPGLVALRRALAPLPDEGTVVVRLNPEDLAALTTRPGAGVDRIDGHRVELVADPALRSGDAVADQGATRVDARLDAALDRVVTSLRGTGGRS